MADYGPSFAAARLYRKTSQKGATYFTGRMGGVKVTLLKSRETADDGGEIWSLMFSEAAPYKPRHEAQEQSQAPVSSLAPPTEQKPRRDLPRSDGPDDEIPF